MLLMVTLTLASLAIGYGMYRWQDLFTLSAIVVPMVVGNLLLGPRLLPWFVVFSMSVLLASVVASTAPLDARRASAIVVSFLVGLVILTSSFRRSQLGVAGLRGESMLIDLRDRIYKQSQIPELPKHWYVDAVLRSAARLQPHWRTNP